MTKQPISPVAKALEKIGTHRPEKISPDYVEKFRQLVDQMIKEPVMKMKFYTVAYDLRFAFDKLPDSGRSLVTLELPPHTTLSRRIPWHDTPHTAQQFIFSIDDDGSLLRLVELSTNGAEPKKIEKVIATNLGVEMGEQFVDFLTSDPNTLVEEVIQFCQTTDQEAVSIAALHHKIMQRGIERRAELDPTP